MSANVHEINTDDFQKEVLSADVPVVVDFWAEWCAPCQAITPILEKLAKKYQGEVKIVKVNVDQNPKLANEYNVRSIPNLIFFDNGEEVEQQLGLASEGQLSDKIDKLI